MTFIKKTKSGARAFLTKGLGYTFIGKPVANFFGYVSSYIKHHRQNQIHLDNVKAKPEKYKIDEGAIWRITKKMEVLNGPFKGLKYPSLTMLSGKYIQGPILSKLLGCYESELHQVIDTVMHRKYSHVLTVGCAEGYYTNGLALRMRDAIHIGYDTDARSREMCLEIAKINDVSSRVKVESLCTPQILSSFIFSDKGLIICDCEGFEAELFNEEVVKNLNNCDVLVELHDFADVNIYPFLHKIFSKTHTEQIFESQVDAKKIREYDYEELKGLNPITIQRIVSEQRPQQEWLFLEPKEII